MHTKRRSLFALLTPIVARKRTSVPLKRTLPNLANPHACELQHVAVSCWCPCHFDSSVGASRFVSHRFQVPRPPPPSSDFRVSVASMVWRVSWRTSRPRRPIPAAGNRCCVAWWPVNPPALSASLSAADCTGVDGRRSSVTRFHPYHQTYNFTPTRAASEPRPA